MSLLKAIGAKDSPRIPYLNTGTHLDFATGAFQLSHTGATLLNGGLAPTNGVVGKQQTFKSTLMLGWMINAMVRFPGSVAYVHDSETSLQRARLCRMHNLYRDDPIRRAEMIESLMTEDEDRQRLVITDRTSHHLESFWEKVKQLAAAKEADKKNQMVESPFMDPATGKPQMMWIPSFVCFDSFSGARTEVGEDLLMDNKASDSTTNMYFMREALVKTKIVDQIVTMASRLGIYFLLSAHIGKKYMENPMTPASKDIQFMKQDDKVKNVGSAFMFYMNNAIETRKAEGLYVDSKRDASRFPYGDGITSPNEMNEVTAVMLRSKNQGAGLQFKPVVSQTYGLDAELSNYHYLREEDYFGLVNADGKSVKGAPTHRPILKQDAVLGRTTATTKLCDYTTARAIEILSQLRYIQESWSLRELLVPFDMTAEKLAEELLNPKAPYAVEDILNSRGWWTYVKPEDAKHYGPVFERPYLSLFDLLAIITGHYKPKFFQIKAAPAETSTVVPLKKAA